MKLSVKPKFQRSEIPGTPEYILKHGNRHQKRAIMSAVKRSIKKSSKK